MKGQTIPMKKLSAKSRDILSKLVDEEIQDKVEAGKAKTSDLAPLFDAKRELEAIDVDPTNGAPKQKKQRNALGRGASQQPRGDEAPQS